MGWCADQHHPGERPAREGRKSVQAVAKWKATRAGAGGDPAPFIRGLQIPEQVEDKDRARHQVLEVLGFGEERKVGCAGLAGDDSGEVAEGGNQIDEEAQHCVAHMSGDYPESSRKIVRERTIFFLVSIEMANIL